MLFAKVLSGPVRLICGSVALGPSAAEHAASEWSKSGKAGEQFEDANERGRVSEGRSGAIYAVKWQRSVGGQRSRQLRTELARSEAAARGAGPRPVARSQQLNGREAD